MSPTPYMPHPSTSRGRAYCYRAPRPTGTPMRTPHTPHHGGRGMGIGVRRRAQGQGYAAGRMPMHRAQHMGTRARTSA